MKQLSEAKQFIIHTLNDGLCHSGSELGTSLGMSRTAIWKHIKQLIELGIPIQQLPKQGYLLKTPFFMLDATAINDNLASIGFNDEAQLHVFSSIDSTNRYLKSLPSSNSLNVCVAELQTNGRGRFNRSWYSPFAENIYCSTKWQISCDLAQLSGLSLVVSLASRSALEAFVPIDDILVKWPNDLMCNHKKLSGTLIEIQVESNGLIDIIIGIGLNVNSVPHEHPELDKAWCSMKEVSGNTINRNQVIAALIKSLDKNLKQFFSQGLPSFTEEWCAVDYLFNQAITVKEPSGDIHGTAVGINDCGLLLVKDQQGVTHAVSSGDTSVKREVRN
jgi:BirA family transcriptional regulator, biotin operon repressor / biotin---[acetyl-CoA-carboxylase] ligase